MMNDDSRFQETFKESGGDMNHIEWDDRDGYDFDDWLGWPEIPLVAALIASVAAFVAAFAWWLS